MASAPFPRPFVSPIVAWDTEDDNGDEWIGDTEVASAFFSRENGRLILLVDNENGSSRFYPTQTDGSGLSI